MVEVELHDQEDKLIAQVLMHHAPAVGDVLWLLPRREQSAWKVAGVYHWVSDRQKHGYHRVCVYVAPL